MGLFELLHWQREGYAEYHRSKANLLLHIVGVPLFLVGNLGLVGALVGLAWKEAAMSLAFMAIGFGIQGKGHAGEESPSVPFSGPGNAVARILLEQWISFPLFVLGGGWSKAMAEASRRH